MQAYSCINSLLTRSESSYGEFQSQMLVLRIEKETYLNLFLTAVACRRSLHPDFNKYVSLLLNFRTITGKKSADINYVGYKDRTSVLMHACKHGNKENIEHVLGIKNVNLHTTDPYGRTALFYAASNTIQSNANAIVNLLLDTDPSLIQGVTSDNTNVLMEAVEMRRIGLVQMLLKRGVDPNLQRRDSEETVAHCAVKKYQQNKEYTIKILLLLLRHRANFHLTNRQGKSVFQSALQTGLDLSQCASLCCPDESDKQSLTTLNQMTKQGDNASELEQIESNICSQRVNFSQVDDFQEDQRDDGIQSISGLLGEQHQLSFSCASELSERAGQGREDRQVGQVQVYVQLMNQVQKQGKKEEKPINVEALSKQITHFASLCEQQQRNVWICLQPFLSSLEKQVSKLGLLIEVVGSFATGLWSPTSDIDINLIPMGSEYLNFEQMLQKIYKILRGRKTQFGISETYLNKNKVSTIKLTLNQKYKNLVIDISIFHRNNQNRTYVTYIIDSINMYPQIKPLFLVFRKLTETFRLNDHLNGGLKTYTLFLMVLAIVKTLNGQSIGQLFNQIALYYGFYYEYQFAINENQSKKGGIYINASSQQEELELWPRPVFNFIDPLNPANNVGGKNTRVRDLENMFKAIYLGLNQMEEEPYLEQLYQIHAIF